jgi:hypothetical protein
MQDLNQELFNHLSKTIEVLNQIIADMNISTRTRVPYKGRFLETRKELQYILRDLQAELEPEHKNLFRRTLREVVYEDVHKGFRLEPTGYDPVLNKYSSKVIQMPITRMLDLIKQAISDSDQAIKTYPEHSELKLIKQDLRSLHRELIKFATEKGLE